MADKECCKALIALLTEEIDAGPSRGIVGAQEERTAVEVGPGPGEEDEEDDDLVAQLKAGSSFMYDRQENHIGQVGFTPERRTPAGERLADWLQRLHLSATALNDPRMSHAFVEVLMRARQEKLTEIHQYLEEYLAGKDLAEHCTHFIAALLAGCDGDAERALNMLDAGLLYCSGPSKKIFTYLPRRRVSRRVSACEEELVRLQQQWWGLYSVINKAMRVVGDQHRLCPAQACPFAPQDRSCEVKNDEASASIVTLFQPFLQHLADLMHALQGEPTLVFRGIPVNVSREYRVGTRFRWSSYTSTSLAQTTAWEYMQGKDGTFFVILSHSACDMRFVCLHDEAELLYPCNALFEVAWKLSPTLMRMIGCDFDVVVVREVEDGNDVQPEHAAALRMEQVARVARATASLFADFLNKYIESRVSDAGGKKEKLLFALIDEWLEKGDVFTNGKTPALARRRPLCITGAGGTGKTSAAVAIFSHLSALAQQKGGKRLLPVFVALSALPDELLGEGKLDEYVMEMYGVDETGAAELAEVFDVVLILDSFDEAGLKREQIEHVVRQLPKDTAPHEQCLLQQQSWCRCASVILTTRAEYLQDEEIDLKLLCGDPREATLLPFGTDDCKQYISKVHTARGEDTSEQSIAAKMTALARCGVEGALQNPYLLSILLEMENAGGVCLESLDFSQVYESFLNYRARERLEHNKDVVGPAVKAYADRAVESAQLLACRMADTNRRQVPLKEAIEIVLNVRDITTREKAVEHLRCLPVRVEDWNDEDLLLAFRHQAIPSYLCSRAIPVFAKFVGNNAKGAPETSRALPGMEPESEEEKTDPLAAAAEWVAQIDRTLKATIKSAPRKGATKEETLAHTTRLRTLADMQCQVTTTMKQLKKQNREAISALPGLVPNLRGLGIISGDKGDAVEPKTRALETVEEKKEKSPRSPCLSVLSDTAEELLSSGAVLAMETQLNALHSALDSVVDAVPYKARGVEAAKQNRRRRELMRIQHKVTDTLTDIKEEGTKAADNMVSSLLDSARKAGVPIPGSDKAKTEESTEGEQTRGLPAMESLDETKSSGSGGGLMDTITSFSPFKGKRALTPEEISVAESTLLALDKALPVAIADVGPQQGTGFKLMKFGGKEKDLKKLHDKVKAALGRKKKWDESLLKDLASIEKGAKEAGVQWET